MVNSIDVNKTELLQAHNNLLAIFISGLPKEKKKKRKKEKRANISIMTNQLDRHPGCTHLPQGEHH